MGDGQGLALRSTKEGMREKPSIMMLDNIFKGINSDLQIGIYKGCESPRQYMKESWMGRGPRCAPLNCCRGAERLPCNSGSPQVLWASTPFTSQVLASNDDQDICCYELVFCPSRTTIVMGLPLAV